jgi:hypothetical protein
MPEKPRNVGASVRQRLLNLARASGQPLELLLTRYALERLLHRLSLSAHRERFVLKGALLLTTWFDEPHRATRDLDLLGYGDPSDESLLAVFREVMGIPCDDGVSFDIARLQVQPIREELEYGGSRLRTTAALAGAFPSSWTSASATPSSQAPKTSSFQCFWRCPRRTCAPTRKRPSSQRRCTRWWCWAWPTAA